MLNGTSYSLYLRPARVRNEIRAAIAYCSRGCCMSRLDILSLKEEAALAVIAIRGERMNSCGGTAIEGL